MTRLFILEACQGTPDFVYLKRGQNSAFVFDAAPLSLSLSTLILEKIFKSSFACVIAVRLPSFQEAAQLVTILVRFAGTYLTKLGIPIYMVFGLD